jgi:predicted transcriptional regulator
MAKTSKAKTKTKTSQKRKVQAKAKTPGTRANSKQAQLIEMLKRPEGATIEEIVKKFAWQAHTVRGAIAGALKKKLGLDVQSEKVEGRGRVYRIAA